MTRRPSPIVRLASRLAVAGTLVVTLPACVLDDPIGREERGEPARGVEHPADGELRRDPATGEWSLDRSIEFGEESDVEKMLDTGRT